MTKTAAARRGRVIRRAALAAALLAAVVLLAASPPRDDLGLTVGPATELAVRTALATVGDVVFADDIQQVRTLVSAYYVGGVPAEPVPFVYELRDEPHLVALRERFDLAAIVAGDGGEYAAQLRLASWIATRFDHGTDEVPGGRQVCDPVSVILAGREKKRFWCEIAARTLAHAAAALGWPARVITASERGYRWDHAVTELWSNQFDKWYVIDADFNAVLEVDGVPMSAWEIVHDGPGLARRNRVHQRPIAPTKAGLVPTDLVELFQYVHVDLRTDWCSRTLRKGSPVGGDRATWWTARPERGPIFGPRRHVLDKAQFEWPVNHVTLTAEGPGERPERVHLATYSPVFDHFEWRVDGGRWLPISGPAPVPAGASRVEARVVTARGDVGPISTLELQSRAMPERASRPAPAEPPAQRAAGGRSS
ncbi:MAG: hypothetical protein ACOYLX_17605 [Burkholderiaceae bacterium]